MTQHPQRRGRQHRTRTTARRWQWAISQWKNMGLDAAQALAQAASDEGAPDGAHHGAV